MPLGNNLGVMMGRAQAANMNLINRARGRVYQPGASINGRTPANQRRGGFVRPGVVHGFDPRRAPGSPLQRRAAGPRSRGGSYSGGAAGAYQRAQDQANASQRQRLMSTLRRYQEGANRQMDVQREGTQRQIDTLGGGGHQRGEANQMAALHAGERAAADGLGYDLDMGTVSDYQGLVNRGLGGYVGPGRGTTGGRFQGSTPELATMGMSRRAREVTGLMERNAARRADVARWGGDHDARTVRDRANIYGQDTAQRVGTHRWADSNIAGTLERVQEEGPNWDQFASANRAIGGGRAYGMGGGGGGAGGNTGMGFNLTGGGVLGRAIGNARGGNPYGGAIAAANRGHRGAWQQGQAWQRQNLRNQGQGNWIRQQRPQYTAAQRRNFTHRANAMRQALGTNALYSPQQIRAWEAGRGRRGGGG